MVIVQKQLISKRYEEKEGTNKHPKPNKEWTFSQSCSEKP